MPENKLPYDWVTDEQREQLAGIVAKFIRGSFQSSREIAPEVYVRAYDLALTLAQGYERTSPHVNPTLRANTSELALDILERARHPRYYSEQ